MRCHSSLNAEPPGPPSPCLAKWQRVHNFIGLSKFMCDVDGETESEEEKRGREGKNKESRVE